MSTSVPTSVTLSAFSLSIDSSVFTTMRSASTSETTPSLLATTEAPESLATIFSMPVPTRGARVFIKGTAWRCIFEPIKARFASSFCKKGIKEAATDTSWVVETSARSASSARTISPSPQRLAPMRSSGLQPTDIEAWAIT